VNCAVGPETGAHQTANVNTQNINAANINSHHYSHNHSLVTNQLLEHLNNVCRLGNNISKEKLAHNNSKCHMQNSGNHQNCLVCTSNNSQNKISNLNEII